MGMVIFVPSKSCKKLCKFEHPGVLESELLAAKPPMGAHDGARVDRPCPRIGSLIAITSNGALEKDRHMPTRAEHYQIVAMTVLSQGCYRHVKLRLNKCPSPPSASPR